MKKLLLSIICLAVICACTNQEIPINESGDRIDNITSGETIKPSEPTKEEIEKEMINEKVSNMTLEEKIEQMLILDYSLVPYGKENEEDATQISDSVKEIISSHNFGGIILFRDNARETKKTLELINSFKMAATSENSKHKIPLFMCVDQEGGRVTRLGTGTSMPGNMALGAINDYDTTKEYAGVIGKELNALGFNVDFAPVLDVNNNPANPIIGVRSFSSDPQRVSKMGEAFIEGLHNENIASTLKHFPGHGDTATDSHTGLPMIDKSLDEIRNLELIPFKAGIDKGADMIMTAHIVYPQIEKTKYISKKTGEEITLPATLSKTILTDILRSELGFEGLIVTDALNMAAIAEHFDKKDVVRYALNADVDILLMPVSLLNNDGNVIDYVTMIAELVRAGEIDEAKIDASVSRILKLKNKMGMFEKSYELTQKDVTNALSIVGSKENHEIEFNISKKAVTLIKGEELLPLDKNAKTIIFTSISNSKDSIDYAIELLKENGIIDDSFAYEVVNYEQKSFDSLKNKTNGADNIIILSNASSAKDFSKTNVGSQGKFIDSAIKEMHNQNKKVVLVSCMLPYDAFRYEDADAIVCVYGNRTISSLPIVYNGETETFGVNISAGIYKLFSNEKFVATIPVDR